jgi:hypothetical protein
VVPIGASWETVERTRTRLTRLGLPVRGVVLNRAGRDEAEAAGLTDEGLAALAEAQSGYPITVEPSPEEMRMQEGAYGGVTFGGMAAAPPTISPGPFSPPGKQAIPHYIGIEAHAAIAQIYDLAHPGDATFFNYIEMSTILRAAARLGMSPLANKLKSADLGLKPDITNLSRSHLYEIKPVNLQYQGVAEAEMYQELFVAAGIPISLGPTMEDGTRGAVPAPAGVYIFESPVPGVIVYRYRQGQALVPERVRATAGERARWRYVLKPWQKAAIASTATVGVGLIILLIIFSPVGA